MMISQRYNEQMGNYLAKLAKASNPLTNADRIRAMSDEELTDFLWHRDIQIVERASKAAGFNYRYDESECKQNIKDWLKSPVEEVGE